MIVKVSGAHWLLPAVFALGVWVALSSTAFYGRYPVSNLANASEQLILTGPATAAWVTYRLPPFLKTLGEARPSRSHAWILTAYWSLLTLGAPMAGVGAMMSATRSFPGGWGSWEVVAVTAAAGLACATVGAAVGCALPRVIGIPLVAVGTFAWIGLPGAGVKVLPRHLNSAFVGCCGDDQQPALSMLLGSGILSLVVIAGCLLLVMSGRSHRKARAATGAALVAIIAGGFGLGAAAASAVPGDMNLLAVEPRTTPMTCRSDHAYRMCAWPENKTGIPQALDSLRTFDTQVRRAGLPGVSAASEDPRDGATTFATADPRLNPEQRLMDIANGYVARATSCEGERTRFVSMVPTAVVALAAGVSPPALSADGLEPADLATAQVILRRPPADVGSWFRAHTCGVFATPPW